MIYPYVYLKMETIKGKMWLPEGIKKMVYFSSVYCLEMFYMSIVEIISKEQEKPWPTMR